MLYGTLDRLFLVNAIMNQIQNEEDTSLTSANDTRENSSNSDVEAAAEATVSSAVVKKTSAVRYAIIGLVVAVALGAAYYMYNRAQEDVAAIVNGTRITEAELTENIAMMTKSAEMQGIDTSEMTVTSEIRTQALENLINNALLIGAAKKEGKVANEAAVQAAYDTLVSELGGEEELKTRMEEVGLTSDTLYKNIGERLMVDSYIESATDIETLTITDEEITTYLTSIETEGVKLPPLEEIKPQIEGTLLAEKQQKLVADLIQKLRTEGEVTIIEQK